MNDKVNKILMNHLCLTEKEITPQATLGCLGADDLEAIEIAMAVEYDCDAVIGVTFEESPDMTVQQLYDAVDAKSEGVKP